MSLGPTKSSMIKSNSYKTFLCQSSCEVSSVPNARIQSMEHNNNSNRIFSCLIVSKGRHNLLLSKSMFFHHQQSAIILQRELPQILRLWILAVLDFWIIFEVIGPFLLLSACITFIWGYLMAWGDRTAKLIRIWLSFHWIFYLYNSILLINSKY